MLKRNDLLAPNRQDSNAGNSGDLVKHTVYLALVRELTRNAPWRDELSIVEAHSGKGVYLSTSPHLRQFGRSEAYPATLLGRAQARAFAEPPAGLGSVDSLGPNEVAYAGSAVLHALELRTLPAGRLTLFDRDAGGRHVAETILREPAFRDLRERAEVVDSDVDSETLVLAALAGGEYHESHVLHFDPFAFVMSDSDAEARSTYGHLLEDANRRVASNALGALSVFFTWGSNSSAALKDLDGTGYDGGGEGRYGDLVGQVDHRCRVVVSWCWVYYFSMLLVIPPQVRTHLLDAIRSALAPLSPFLSRLDLS